MCLVFASLGVFNSIVLLFSSFSILKRVSVSNLLLAINITFCSKRNKFVGSARGCCDVIVKRGSGGGISLTSHLN